MGVVGDDSSDGVEDRESDEELRVTAVGGEVDGDVERRGDAGEREEEWQDGCGGGGEDRHEGIDGFVPQHECAAPALVAHHGHVWVELVVTVEGEVVVGRDGGEDCLAVALEQLWLGQADQCWVAG